MISWAIMPSLIESSLVNSAVYVLMALGICLVFSVTRVAFISYGDLIAYSVLTLAAIESGEVPGTVWLLVSMALLATALQIVALLRAGEVRRIPGSVARILGFPVAVTLVVYATASWAMPKWAQFLMTFAIITPMGFLIYSLVFQRAAQASILVLMMIATALHFVLTGLALVYFGAEGVRTQAYFSGGMRFGSVYIANQSLLICTASVGAAVLLFVVFRFTAFGRALQATAINARGARLIGISPVWSGGVSFTIAALLAAFAGILIGPVTTIYYDTGFLVGIKGFIGAVVGGFISYPLAIAGSVLIGLIESFSSFIWSDLKDVLVFLLIIPVLLIRLAVKQDDGVADERGE